MGYFRLKSKWDKTRYQISMNKALGFNFPDKDIDTANIYTYERYGLFLAGFMLKKIRSKYTDLRCLRQIPIDSFTRYVIPRLVDLDIKKQKVCEINGYFILDKSISNWFKFRMMITILLTNAKYFFYSYQSINEKLSAYYSNGNPKLIYRGPVMYQILDDSGKIETKFSNENVCALTKLGVIKIFLNGLFKWKKYQPI